MPDITTTLRERFEANRDRHPQVNWADVEARLTPEVLKVLEQMEATGGEPDVVAALSTGGKIAFVDCSAESPEGRRSLCFDRAALDARKKNKPEGAAMEMAAKMGMDLLDEAQYRALQGVGVFDLKTSSWIATPAAIRAKGGALFCDRRYGAVFTYHNGAESYYAARGFRGILQV